MLFLLLISEHGASCNVEALLYLKMSYFLADFWNYAGRMFYHEYNIYITLIHKTLIYCTVGLLPISLLILHIVNFRIKFVEFE